MSGTAAIPSVMEEKKITFEFDIQVEQKIPPQYRELTPPAQILDDTEKTSPQDFFTNLSISDNVDKSDGLNFTIDVQPDFRFPVRYMIYQSIVEYDKLKAEHYPCVTTFTLAAYRQALYGAVLLCNDLYARSTASPFAASFKSTDYLSKFIGRMLDLPVPNDVADLVKTIGPLNDCQKKRLQFIPCLGSFSLANDFARFFPIRIFLAAHAIIASSRAAAEPMVLVNQFYDTIIYIINNHNFTVSNILGTNLLHNNVAQTHRNWVNTVFRTLFNPVTARQLHMRAALEPLNTVPITYANADLFNPYVEILGLDSLNQVSINRFYSDLSQFYSKTSTKLGQILSTLTGTAILAHSIEPPTLPTWHTLPVSTGKETEPPLITDDQYAVLIGFLQQQAPLTGTLPPTTPETAPIYLVDKGSFDPDTNPFRRMLFNSEVNVYPNVLLFAPYQKATEHYASAIVHGIKIEQANIDGVNIPYPDPTVPLNVNNSRYLAGSIPVTKVRAVYANDLVMRHVNITDRTRSNKSSYPKSVLINDPFVNRLPILASANVSDITQVDYSRVAHVVPNCRDPEESFTYVMWKHPDQPDIPDSYTYLWSSYRHRTHTSAGTSNVYFYSTLRALYGLDVPLARSANPVLLFPF